jgi:hypothetical protein
MAVDEQLDRLNQQLSRQSLGPINSILDQAVSGFSRASASLAGWLRDSAYDRPLITLLLSFQAGYLVARIGRRYARH